MQLPQDQDQGDMVLTITSEITGARHQVRHLQRHHAGGTVAQGRRGVFFAIVFFKTIFVACFELSIA
ncbi:hypothetical protein D3C83_163450 [compost metagenome]